MTRGLLAARVVAFCDTGMVPWRGMCATPVSESMALVRFECDMRGGRTRPIRLIVPVLPGRSERAEA
jgi:hypothetical protein